MGRITGTNNCMQQEQIINRFIIIIEKDSSGSAVVNCTYFNLLVEIYLLIFIENVIVIIIQGIRLMITIR